MPMAKVLQVSYRWVAFQGLYLVSMISVISATPGSQAVPLGKGHRQESLVLLTVWEPRGTLHLLPIFTELEAHYFFLGFIFINSK